MISIYSRPLALGALLVAGAASASACTFSAFTKFKLDFAALPAGVSLSFKSSSDFDSIATGSGQAAASATSGLLAPGVYGSTVQVDGSVPTLGTSSASANATMTFILKNTTGAVVNFDVLFEIEQLAKVSDYDINDPVDAYSAIASPGALGLGLGIVYADPSFDEDAFDDAEDFGVTLRPFETTTLNFSSTATGYSNPVPEPASMVALGLGAAAMLRRRRK